jgi:pimeloyl-ACP methyl ester carboxylesterase
MINRLAFLMPIFLLSSNLMIQAAILDDSIPPGNNFDKAAFRFWYPDDYQTIKGVIVLMPGSNGDGRDWVYDEFWQTLAKKHNFALLGCFFTDQEHEDMDIEYYANAKEGSGQALLTALSHFAEKSGFPEAADAPLILWGHSAGGQFNYEFVCWKPERVIAFVVNKGGIYFTALAPKPARNVPGLIFTGENDYPPRKDILKGIYSLNRRVGALWVFAEEPKAGHEIGQTQKLAGLFFDEIIPLRLQETLSGSGVSGSLKTLSISQGFAGDLKSKKFIPMTDELGNYFAVSWLPTLKFAEAWQSFGKNKPF